MTEAISRPSSSVAGQHGFQGFCLPEASISMFMLGMSAECRAQLRTSGINFGLLNPKPPIGVLPVGVTVMVVSLLLRQRSKLASTF